jgi:hypothetical protein
LGTSTETLTGFILGERLEAVVELDPEGVQCEGEHVVVADDHRRLNQPLGVVGLGERRPGRVSNARCLVQLVRGA